MVEFNDLPTLRFGVKHVPAHAKWGNVVNGIDNSKYLCLDDVPLGVWLVGFIGSKWFQNLQGTPQDRVNIGLSLFRSEDVEAAVKMLSNSKPVKQPKGELIYAGRFMSDWVKGESKPVISMFEEIYDARKEGTRRADLPRKMPYDLGLGDLVLVEAFMTRYKTGNTRRGWDTWNTGFELSTISIIGEVPLGPAVSTPMLNGDERVL